MAVRVMFLAVMLYFRRLACMRSRPLALRRLHVLPHPRK